MRALQMGLEIRRLPINLVEDEPARVGRLLEHIEPQATRLIAQGRRRVLKNEIARTGSIFRPCDEFDEDRASLHLATSATPPSRTRTSLRNTRRSDGRGLPGYIAGHAVFATSPT